MAKGKILVVDDEIYIVHILDSAWGWRGIRCSPLSTANRPREGACEHPDLIVLDIMMPKLDATRPARRSVGRVDRAIPVILLSAKGRT